MHIKPLRTYKGKYAWSVDFSPVKAHGEALVNLADTQKDDSN